MGCVMRRLWIGTVYLGLSVLLLGVVVLGLFGLGWLIVNIRSLFGWVGLGVVVFVVVAYILGFIIDGDNNNSYY